METFACVIVCLLSVIQTIYSSPANKNACRTLDPDLVPHDGRCNDSSVCVTRLCQDDHCACPPNYRYDSCGLTCHIEVVAENDEDEQIMAMKAGTTAIGTLILIVVLFIIVLKGRAKDDNPIITEQKSKEVSKKQANNGVKSKYVSQSKQSQHTERQESCKKSVPSKESSNTAKDQIFTINSGYVYENTGFTDSTSEMDKNFDDQLTYL